MRRRTDDPGELRERARRDDRLELLRRAREVGLFHSEAVGVRCRHHELPRLEAREDAGEHRPRLVARRRPRHLRDRLEQRLRVDREDLGVVDVGQPRKVLGAVRVQPVARRAARDCEYAVLDAMLDLDVGIREQPRDVHEQATGYDHGAVALNLRLERRAERELHVRRGKTKLTRRSVQQHTGENLHRAPCRDGSGDDPEPADELLSTTRDFHAGTDHYVCFHHLSKNLVVVRRGC